MPGSNRMHRLLLVLIFLAAAPGAFAADARDLLVRMAETMRNGAYEGTFVYQRAGEVQTLTLAHGVFDGVVHERLSTLSGEPFEVVRVGERVTCVWPRESEAVVARRPEELLPTRSLAGFAELPRSYVAELTGSERTAGRMADVVSIRARDDSRYGYRMWLGREDHLLLRSELVGPDGEVLERMVFTRVDMVGNLSVKRFTPDIDEGRYAEH